MTTANYVAKEEKSQPAMQALLSRFASNLEKLGNISDAFENLGHRLSNTNYPTADTPQAKIASVHQNEGILSELELKVNRLDSLISRLEEVNKKMGEII